MFRYPDKPLGNMAAPGLADLPEVYIAQLKFDGWRCVIERTAAGLSFTSRHNKPLPVSGDLARDWAEILAHAPIGMIIDGEWLARRPGWRSEALWVFDLMQHRQPLWGVSLRERLALLQSVVPLDRIAPMAVSDYAGFYDAMRPRGDGEGIVLKRADSRYIGSFRQSATNPAWVRCKWRGGEDGCTAIGSHANISL